ncbi:hypothetical protein FRC11_012161 [Ceratobasidium sp. 423]|nr:hypothetical protein FRC11_012161 [Ceratobasidium sp. 423]
MTYSKFFINIFSLYFIYELVRHWGQDGMWRRDPNNGNIHGNPGSTSRAVRPQHPRSDGAIVEEEEEEEEEAEEGGWGNNDGDGDDEDEEDEDEDEEDQPPPPPRPRAHPSNHVSDAVALPVNQRTALRYWSKVKTWFELRHLPLLFVAPTPGHPHVSPFKGLINLPPAPADFKPPLSSLALEWITSMVV